MKLLAAIAFPLFLLDQGTKILIRRDFLVGDGVTVAPGFLDVVYVTNTGAAFGMLHDSNLFFMLLSALVLVALAVLYARGAFAGKAAQIPLALLVAGIAGNLTDRIWHHYVVDFADFHVGDHHWPAFNVADSCICIAAALFAFQSFREEKQNQKS